LINIVSDPGRGPGKYEYENDTRMINNFMPSIYSTKGYFKLGFSLGNVTFPKVYDS